MEQEVKNYIDNNFRRIEAKLLSVNVTQEEIKPNNFTERKIICRHCGNTQVKLGSILILSSTLCMKCNSVGNWIEGV